MNAEPSRSGNSPSDVPAKSDERTTQSGAASGAGDEPGAAELAKEEQWALFEKELKESDWGHQPC